MLFLIDAATRDSYADELDGIFSLRHQVLCNEYKWHGISATDDRETDQFDCRDAIYLGVRNTAGQVVACLRLNPSHRPTLTSEVFRDLVEFTDLPSGPLFYDVSRLVLASEVRGDPLGAGLDLMCAMYEWGLAHRVTGYTAVTSLRVLSWLLQIGMKIDALGLPRTIEGEPTVAIYLPVVTASLANLYSKSRNPKPRLLQFTRQVRHGDATAATVH